LYNGQRDLEKRLDRAVESGRLEEAAGISDAIARQDLARKMATALDSVEYEKRCKVSAASCYIPCILFHSELSAVSLNLAML